MEPPPPPPPPHSDGPKASGLPHGNYDIFIIPPHSSGSGFLYLPSLTPHRNSFLAGVACTLTSVLALQTVTPVLKDWFRSMVATGGNSVMVLMIAVGIAGWAWGKTQTETSGPGPKGGDRPKPDERPFGGTPNGPPPPPGGVPDPHTQGGFPHASGGPPPSGYAQGGFPHASNGVPPRPKPTWQRTNQSTPGAGGFAASGARSGWEKAKEETRKREEERRRKEEQAEQERRRKEEQEEQERKAKEAAEKAKWEQARTREREAREREARERREKEQKEQREKERLERMERPERPERAERPERPERARTAYAPSNAEGRSDARPPRPPPSTPSSPRKSHQQPTAKTYLGSDEEAYSFRPYDKPKRPTNKQQSQSSMYSESSYAASQSTSRTTPPPSHRGPYTTKDPDKIVIKGVYSFNNAYTKLPTAQLVSGVGSVTDGLILRITTEGLFIDDDVRGVPQREWDVKAWTMKLVEVWCSSLLDRSQNISSGEKTSPGKRALFSLRSMSPEETSDAESNAFLDFLSKSCSSGCNQSSPLILSFPDKLSSAPKITSTNDELSDMQSTEFKGLHLLRASIRDQEGRKYLFVLEDSESWKVAVGLQRLRRGTQVRALGVSGLGNAEAKGILESLGWT